MDQDNQTISNEGESSAPAPTTQSEELVSTVDLAMPADTDPEGANNTGDSTDKSADDKGTAKAENQNDDFDSRFDKHPRFQELNNRMKAAEEQNRLLLERIANIQPSAAPTEKPAPLPYKDLSTMTEEELLDWQADDPRGFVDNINKMVAHQVETGINDAMARQSEQNQQMALETRVEATYQKYAEQNPDFDSMWDSGEIKQFMDKNPGHNAISAHMFLTAENRQKASIEKAVQEALQKAEKDRQSVRKAGSILPAGPARVQTNPQNSDVELKNPSKFGGATSVLAARLERRRAGKF